MAEPKGRRTQPLALAAFVLALVALALAVVMFSKVYNLGELIGELQNRLQGNEERAQKQSDSRHFDIRTIGAKIAEAKDNIVNKENRARALKHLGEAREMMNNYKERVAPALQQRWTDIMSQTEQVTELVKSRARGAGEKLDDLAKSIEHFFADEESQSESPGQTEENLQKSK
jgi:hypothetical protein